MHPKFPNHLSPFFSATNHLHRSELHDTLNSRMSDVIEPTAKRVRLDSPQPDSADIVLDLVAPVVAAPPRELSRYEKSVKLFSFEGETGMFGAMKDSIGVAPVTEEEVGITEYMDPSIAAITGIIKHRCALTFLSIRIRRRGLTTTGEM